MFDPTPLHIKGHTSYTPIYTYNVQYNNIAIYVHVVVKVAISSCSMKTLAHLQGMLYSNATKFYYHLFLMKMQCAENLKVGYKFSFNFVCHWKIYEYLCNEYVCLFVEESATNEHKQDVLVSTETVADAALRRDNEGITVMPCFSHCVDQ